MFSFEMQRNDLEMLTQDVVLVCVIHIDKNWFGSLPFTMLEQKRELHEYIIYL